jgi:hypothetical protein
MTALLVVAEHRKEGSRFRCISRDCHLVKNDSLLFVVVGAFFEGLFIERPRESSMIFFLFDLQNEKRMSWRLLYCRGGRRGDEGTAFGRALQRCMTARACLIVAVFYRI